MQKFGTCTRLSKGVRLGFQMQFAVCLKRGGCSWELSSTLSPSQKYVDALVDGIHSYKFESFIHAVSQRTSPTTSVNFNKHTSINFSIGKYH